MGCVDFGNYIISSVTKEYTEIPVDLLLYQNYPNPFNPVTVISFSLKRSEYVELSVYSLLGERITTLIKEFIPPGFYQKHFAPHNISSGIYIYKLNVGNRCFSRKMMYIK